MCSNGVHLSRCVDALAAVDVRALPAGGLQDLVAAGSSARNRLDGVISRAVGELQIRGGGAVPDPTVAGATCPTPAWLRSVSQSTPHAAGRVVRTSVALRELPAVAEAIIDGQIGLEHGRVLTGLVGKIDPDALLRSQLELIEVARRCDPDRLADYVRHLIATWCEPALEAEESAADSARFFTMRNKRNGRWRGTFDVPDAVAETIQTVIEPLARREGDKDARTAGQRRADALNDVFGLALRYGELPDAGGIRPRLTLLLPAEWAVQRRAWVNQFGLGDSAGLSRTEDFTVDLDRHPGAACPTAPWTGPVTRAQIGTVLCDARIDRLVLDEDGQIVSLVSVAEQITASQRRAVAARDRCCTTKGCSRPPAFCDVHHLRARADGGRTDVDNLVLLCRRHHVMWHRQQLSLPDLRVPWKRLPQPRAPSIE